MKRQHQGMDRPVVRQVPVDSGEQGKMEDTGCEVVCGTPTTLAVKGYVKVKVRDVSGCRWWYPETISDDLKIRSSVMNIELAVPQALLERAARMSFVHGNDLL